jgi:hypothetical protein
MKTIKINKNSLNVCEDEEYDLMGFNAVQIGRSSRTFRRNVSSHVDKVFVLECFEIQDKCQYKKFLI